MKTQKPQGKTLQGLTFVPGCTLPLYRTVLSCAGLTATPVSLLIRTWQIRRELTVSRHHRQITDRNQVHGSRNRAARIGNPASVYAIDILKDIPKDAF